MVYQDVIQTKEVAFCHLLLYFSLYEDETFKGEETYQVFSILKAYPFTAEVNFPEEVIVFFDYKAAITDEAKYFKYLIQTMEHPYPSLVLFNAAQVAMSDTIYSDKDDTSLWLLSRALEINKEDAAMVINLALAERIEKQRKAK